MESLFFIAWYLDHDRDMTFPIRHRFAYSTFTEAREAANALAFTNLDIWIIWIYNERDENLYTWERRKDIP